MNTTINGTLRRTIPTLRTDRLILRPLELTDGPRVRDLAGAKEIADVTDRIPHPYLDGLAEQWIATHADEYKRGKSAIFAITQAWDGLLIGAIGLELKNRQGEMGYWLGMDYWGKGFCTEAAEEVLRFGFEDLDLSRIHAQHFSRNPASGRVMEKIGMTYEGTLRQHVEKNGKFENVECYGILRAEW